MERAIYNFLKEQSLFSVCTSLNNMPHSAICYYAFDEKSNCLVFSSERKTKHVQDALQNKHVAGTIISSKAWNGIVKGLQFTGILLHPDKFAEHSTHSLYYKKYPLALGMKGELWLIQLVSIKMTDTTLGLNRKIEWIK